MAGEDSAKEFDDAIAGEPASEVLRPDVPLPDMSRIPVDEKTGVPGSFALWVRMLFSALVDADFLDTEAFMNARQAASREGFASIEQLLEVFDTHMRQLSVEAAPTLVNRLRAEVLHQCREKAEYAPGVFTLTVPTGGGKTLSSLAFALRHAARHRKRRII